VNKITIDKAARGSGFSSSCRGIILTVVLIIFSSIEYAYALDIRFKYISYQEDSIRTELVISDSLPPKITGHIDKGVPISIDYNLELWKVRPGWFDSRQAAFGLTYKVRYDTWSKEYTVLEIRPDLTIENKLSGRRETYDLILGTDNVAFAPTDTSASYYLTGKIVVKLMTLSNFEEVESWLKGEISEMERPELEKAPNRFSEFLFNTALKVTGLENSSKDTKSKTFTINDLPIRFETNSR